MNTLERIILITCLAYSSVCLVGGNIGSMVVILIGICYIVFKVNNGNEDNTETVRRIERFQSEEYNPDAINLFRLQGKIKEEFEYMANFSKDYVKELMANGFYVTPSLSKVEGKTLCTTIPSKGSVNASLLMGVRVVQPEMRYTMETRKVTLQTIADFTRTMDITNDKDLEELKRLQQEFTQGN